MRRAARLLGLYLAVLLACGACASTGGQQTAQDAAQFNTLTFNTLLVTQAAIEQAKLEANSRAEVLAVNAAVALYNTAEAGFQAYKRGELTAPDIATLTSQVTAAVTEVAELWKLLHPEEVTP